VCYNTTNTNPKGGDGNAEGKEESGKEEDGQEGGKEEGGKEEGEEEMTGAIAHSYLLSYDSSGQMLSSPPPTERGTQSGECVLHPAQEKAMQPTILVLYYSMFGNTHRMAQAVCEGIASTGALARLRQVPDLLPDDVIASDVRIRAAKDAQKEVPTATLEDFAGIDGIVLGSPTRFGNMCSQMRNFLDRTGSLWMKAALAGKPAGVFCCTGTLHGGQESTLLSMMLTLLHHGCIIIGVHPATPELFRTTGGGSPYGASAVVGPSADIPPLPEDLAVAAALGARVAECARRMKSSHDNHLDRERSG